MLKRIAIFAAAVCAAAGAAAQQQPRADAPALFGAREKIEQMAISPDGRRIVYLTPMAGRGTAIVVQALDGEPRVITRASGDPDRVSSCRFVTDDRLVCRVHLMTTVDNFLLPIQRLFAIDADGGNLRQLGQRNTGNEARFRQFDGSVIDWLPGSNGEVLIMREYIPDGGGTAETRQVRRENGLGVDRVDVRTLRADRIERPDERASLFMSDGRGSVRIKGVRAVQGGTGQIRSRISYFYRVQGSDAWRPFSTVDEETGADFAPIGVDPDLNVAYSLRKLNGRYALYRVKLDGTLASELVYAHERVDIDDVVRVSHGTRIVGVTFAEDRRRVVYFDPEWARLHSDLARAIPNLPLIDIVSSSADGQRMLIHAGSDNDPGRYFMFDRSTRNLAEIIPARPELENVRLANVRSVSYPAADGTRIPAYLTLPPGREARGLPAVVLPHGGPSARDEWGFDWLAQFLANQGYAVLQPNYRGSAGFGDAWMQSNGFRGWRTSIGDVAAGARWLSAEGIADASKLAIVGWSYGGYAALQAGATEPDLFRAIVAIAPVVDLQQLRDDYRNYTSGSLVERFIGTGTHVSEGSPLQNVRRIAAPVLLFHGDRDLNVRVVHARRMHAALRDAGKQSELTIFDGLEHDLADSTARTQMLTRIGAFLRERIGAR
ncbi:MAG TPA: alpha/beta fold hydrolase [Allosphingosinicella sp.]|nr:alpha/beta fold hydrolase [Allosphingosinicella sp.]